MKTTRHSAEIAILEYPGSTAAELAHHKGLDPDLTGLCLLQAEKAGRVIRKAPRTCLVRKTKSITWWPVQ